MTQETSKNDTEALLNDYPDVEDIEVTTEKLDVEEYAEEDAKYKIHINHTESDAAWIETLTFVPEESNYRIFESTEVYDAEANVRTESHTEINERIEDVVHKGDDVTIENFVDAWAHAGDIQACFEPVIKGFTK